MAPSQPLRDCFRRVPALARRLVLAVAAFLVVSFGHLPTATAATPPYPEAVNHIRKAAHAVLDRAGTESCLRGKLTRALLGLSNSCEASGERNDLCRLADKAVVETPMSLSFMDDTSRQLLQLSEPSSASAQAPKAP